MGIKSSQLLNKRYFPINFPKSAGSFFLRLLVYYSVNRIKERMTENELEEN
jgi:hypothetical protein